MTRADELRKELSECQYELCDNCRISRAELKGIETAEKEAEEYYNWGIKEFEKLKNQDFADWLKDRQKELWDGRSIGQEIDNKIKELRGENE